MSRSRPILVAAAAAFTVAALGGGMTQIGPWYRSLAKPDWTPPDPAFGIVWTVIFALAAASGVVAWRRGNRPQRLAICGLFALNGVLNVAWSALFFGLRRPDLALIEVVFLWSSILLLIVVFWRWSPLAGALLVPYLVWVSIAWALNAEVVRLNPAFG